MDTSHGAGESGGTPHRTRGSGGTQDGAGGSGGGSPHRTGVPARRSAPCGRCARQVEAVISRHREELLAERYRFNMGLLMGERGQRGPCALIPSCLVSRPPPGFLWCPAGGAGAPSALRVHPGAAGPGFGAGNPGPSPTLCSPLQGRRAAGCSGRTGRASRTRWICRWVPVPWGCGAGDISSCVGVGQAAGHGAALGPWGAVRRCFFSQVLHLLGPKTEADLEKKPKVMQGGRLGAGMVFFWLCSPGHTRGRALGWFPALCVVPLLLGCPAAAPGWGQGSWEVGRGALEPGAEAVLVPAGYEGPAGPGGEAEGTRGGER